MDTLRKQPLIASASNKKNMIETPSQGQFIPSETNPNDSPTVYQMS